MSISEFLVAVIWGILITLFLEIIGVLLWFYSIADLSPSHNTTHSTTHRPHTQQNTRPVPPTTIRHIPDDQSPIDNETCHWLNRLIDLGFHQLRDSPELKKLMMKQINKEFTEILLTKTQGKMLERLSVREYDMGTCLPVISNIAVVKDEKDEDNQNKPTNVEVEMDVEYSGGFQLSIDADLVFNKAAYVSVKANMIKGRGRFQFSTVPFTYWSFAFLTDPELNLSVASRFEGRELPQLSGFIKAQIIRWVRKFHTLPNYKVRFKPFFQKIKYQDQLMDVHVHDSLITRGELLVNIIDCSRLVIPDTAIELYCTASIGETPSDPQIGIWQRAWPCIEISICKTSPTQHLGIRYKSFLLNDEGKKTTVIVTQVIPHSPSHHGGIIQGDIIQKIDSTSISNSPQAEKLIRNTRKLKILITIRRPTIDILKIICDKTIEETQRNKKRMRSKSPKISSKGTVTPVVETREENEGDTIPPLLLTESMVNESEGEDDNNGGGGGTDEFEIIHPGGINITGRRLLMKERALSTPPTLDTNIHRPLATSLEPPELTTSYQGTSPPSTSPQEPDNVSMRVSPDYSIESHDSHTTKTVSVSRNPIWNEELKYLVTSKSRYLNVCVWCRLQGEHRNLMIGCVTLSLTDISLECSASGIHRQRYVLLPGKDMKTSKIALKAMNELPSNAKIGVSNTVTKYVGDIFLSFIHEPMEVPRDDTLEASFEHKDSLTEVDKTFRIHPFTADESSTPDKHTFQVYDVTKSTKHCYVCQKKIRKKARKCSRCRILAHDKCVHYCMSVVLCKFVNDGCHDNNDQNWVELDNVGDQIMYTESRQMMTEINEDVDSTHSLSEEPLEDNNYRIGETNTPPPDCNSDSDDEIRSQGNPGLEENSGLHGFVDIITPQELEVKILYAQKQLEMLEDNKRELSTANPPLSQENLEYKLQKYDAQIETTNIKLQEYKECMRKLYCGEN